jgi:hypothetical protein
MQIKAIAVIEVINVSNPTINLITFSADENGHKEAVSLFKQLVKENSDEVDDKTMEQYLEDGYCDIGDSFIAIVGSNANRQPWSHYV